MTPQSTFEYQSPPWRASSGNSTNSASGFSSNNKEKYDPGPDRVVPDEPGGAPGFPVV